MKTIEEIQSELRALAHELDQLKESRSAGEHEIDFERLSIDGSHKPITPHPLSKFDSYAQKSYLTMLLTMARFEEDRLPESLLFAHRIAFGMGYLQKGGNLQSEYIAAQTLSYKQLDDLVELFKGTDERLMLILECMLTAGAFDKGKKDAIDYIVQLSQLLELSREDMVFLSNMAAVILTQDLNAYKCDIRNKYEAFDCYLNKFDYKIKVVNEKNGEGEHKVFFVELFADGLHCVEIFLEKNILKYRYSFGDDGNGNESEASLYSDEFGRQEVEKNFVLVANAEDIMPACPIGFVTHPLAPFSLVRNAYIKAKEQFVRKISRDPTLRRIYDELEDKKTSRDVVSKKRK